MEHNQKQNAVSNKDGTVTVDGYTFRKDTLFGGIEIYGARNVYRDGQATDDLDWMVPKEDTDVYELAKEALLPTRRSLPEGGKLPENAYLLMTIQHTGKAPSELPASTLSKESVLPCRFQTPCISCPLG